jgi:hypothetical protein
VEGRILTVEALERAIESRRYPFTHDEIARQLLDALRREAE